MSLQPTDARVADNGVLLIAWSDGRTLEYPMDLLRAACPCAHCNPDMGLRPMQAREGFLGVSLSRLEEVGTYAFRIGFDDGHSLGIYTWNRLLELGVPEGTTPPPPAPFDV